MILRRTFPVFWKAGQKHTHTLQYDRALLVGVLGEPDFAARLPGVENPPAEFWVFEQLDPRKPGDEAVLQVWKNTAIGDQWLVWAETDHHYRQLVEGISRKESEK